MQSKGGYIYVAPLLILFSQTIRIPSNNFVIRQRPNSRAIHKLLLNPSQNQSKSLIPPTIWTECIPKLGQICNIEILKLIFFNFTNHIIYRVEYR